MSLFSSIGSTASTLAAFTRALNVSQNNVANASTAGYARQIQNFSARSFDPVRGTAGGVTAGEIQSARDSFADTNVRSQNSQLGSSDQKLISLSSLESIFDISGKSGLPAAFNSLNTAFSNWSVSPGDSIARQGVIQSASDVASAFRATSLRVSTVAAESDSQLKSLTGQINSYASQIQADNIRIQAGNKNDAGLLADLHSKIEELSALANISTLSQPDGTVTVLLGGQTTLVAGSQRYEISANFGVPVTPTPVYSPAPPAAQIHDANGNDITDTVTAGRLGGVLTVRNHDIPSIVGDATHPGSLNELAKAFADRVNELLGSGRVSDDPPVQPGRPLFAYDAANATNSAASLKLDEAATAASLAAIGPAKTGGESTSNGTALRLAGLVSSRDVADQIQGQPYTHFFGSIAGSVGAALASARDNQLVETSLVAQARSLRDQSSGVSLDQEAVNVLELQRSYQAAAKLLSVMDSLTQAALDMIR